MPPRYRRNRRRTRRRRMPVTTLVKREVKSQLKNNLETKHVAGFIDQTVLSNAFTDEIIELLFDDPSSGQGTGDNQFVGDEVRLRGLSARWEILQADATNSVRLIIFEAQPNYVPQIGSLELFETTLKPFISTFNRELVKRVHLDRTYFMGGTPNGQNARVIRGRKYIKLHNRRCKFKDPQPGQIDANVKLYAYLISDSNLAPSPRCTLLLDLGYTDA